MNDGDDDDDDKQIANAGSVNNLMREWNTSYQHAQY
jgi:hypothetical protein